MFYLQVPPKTLDNETGPYTNTTSYQLNLYPTLYFIHAHSFQPIICRFMPVFLFRMHPQHRILITYHKRLVQVSLEQCNDVQIHFAF